jgi:hypothetical protein
MDCFASLAMTAKFAASDGAKLWASPVASAGPAGVDIDQIEVSIIWTASSPFAPIPL